MKTVELLISPDEVVTIHKKRGYTDIYKADAIIEAFLLHNPPSPEAEKNERLAYSAFLRAALYNAGRVCGVREERARRNGKTAKTYTVDIEYP